MKVTVYSEDLDRLINFLPPFKEMFSEDRKAAIRIISALGEGKTPIEHEVYISCNGNRVNAIRFIRALFGLGLKEAKDITDVHNWEYKPAGVIVGPLDLAKSLAKDNNVEVTFKPV